MGVRVLLLGATGLLGSELKAALQPMGEVIAPTRVELDLSRAAEVEARALAIQPDLIVNASAQADVDRAELEREMTQAVNVDAVAALGRAASRAGVPIVHVSTDYVFAGDKGAAYVETDPPGPLSHYGATKLAGEEALLAIDADAVVLRTAWLIGRSPRSFVSRMLALAATRDVLEVADDQSSSPTSVIELSRIVVAVARRLLEAHPGERDALRGVYHAAGAGAATRVDLVRAALELSPRRAQLRAREVVPVSGDRFPRAASRPRHTPLSTEKLRATFHVDLLPWREGLARALAEPETRA